MAKNIRMNNERIFGITLRLEEIFLGQSLRLSVLSRCARLNGRNSRSRLEIEKITLADLYVTETYVTK